MPLANTIAGMHQEISNDERTDEAFKEDLFIVINLIIPLFNFSRDK